MEPIEFDAQMYSLKIDQLKRAVSALDDKGALKANLSETTLKNVGELCRAAEEWQKLVSNYHQALEHEVSKLTKIGADIVKMDQQLAQKIDAELKNL